MNNGTTHILKGILQDIEKDGSASIDWIVLRNTAFKTGEGLPSPSEKMQVWAKDNNLHCAEFIIPDVRKKNRENKSVIKFTRR